ncbi:MAG: serine/threonine-protein kinase [Candidatus Eremiobacteraeota bacterium]|nr:serine/threonine-protein kinase [Candidatus Eremiobacteraeota bacterium]
MHHELSAGTVLNERFSIVKVIGEGAAGVVYCADDLRETGQRCAVKEMAPLHAGEAERREALAMFRREAEILKCLDHGGLPKIIDFFSDGERHYLAMEYIAGENLHTIAKARSRPFDYRELAPWVLQILSILEYLHSQPTPVIFRDLKPSNILVTKLNRVKLIDFGIARLFAPEKTRDTFVMGTPGFSAPEQYGTWQTDGRSDLYSLAVTIYWLLTGEDPEQFAFRFPPVTQFNAAVPPWLEEALEKCLDEDPGRRFQSAAEMKGYFEEAALGRPAMPAPSYASSPPLTGWPAFQKDPPVAIFVVLGIVLKVLVFPFLVTGDKLLLATIAALAIATLAVRFFWPAPAGTAPGVGASAGP